MAVLRYENVTKKYGKMTAVDNMSFETKDGEFLVILGPSGAGKTTTLKIACGLVNPNAGRVFLDSEDITKIPPYHRDIAITFENYALYPHMTVFDNMAYPLRSVKGAFSEEDIRKRVVSVATMLHIDPLLERFPDEASGGQKQRIALGRTMVRKPKVYLLDEPLAHLDAKIRVEILVDAPGEIHVPDDSINAAQEHMDRFLDRQPLASSALDDQHVGKRAEEVPHEVDRMGAVIDEHAPSTNGRVGIPSRRHVYF